MPGKQAKVVTSPMLRRMLRRTSRTPFPVRDRAMILLSVKAGLRACEIARLEWSMALDARGKVTDILAIHDAIAKKRGGRRIPMHPDLRRALRSLLQISEPCGPVIRSARVAICARPAWSTGLRRCSKSSASRDARRTPADEPSSPPPRATSTAAVAACATSSCLPGTDRSRPPSVTSMATPAGRGGWSLCCELRPSQPRYQYRRGTPAMHPYERWVIRRYLGNALRSNRFVRPPSADSEIFTWIDSHSCLLGLPEVGSGTLSSRRRLAIEAPIHSARWKAWRVNAMASLASLRLTLRLFKSASIGSPGRARSTAVRAESSVFWRERRGHQRSVVLSKRSTTGSTWTVRSSSRFLGRTPSGSSSRPEADSPNLV
jgi:Phage integrase family